MWKRHKDDGGGTIPFHGKPISRLKCYLGSRQLQLEFSCESTLDEEIWLLLTRHVVDTHRTSDFTALRVEVEDDLAPRGNAVENQHIISSKVR